jgi:hypothetical protein
MFVRALFAVLLAVCRAGPIVDECAAYLHSHELEGERWGMPFFFYRPSLVKYGPSQWLWDSGCHQTVMSHLNVSNSIRDLRTLLQLQQANGRVPECIFWGKQTLATDALNEVLYGSLEATPITQTPMIVFSLQRIFAATGDVAVLKESVVDVLMALVSHSSFLRSVVVWLWFSSLTLPHSGS